MKDKKTPVTDLPVKEALVGFSTESLLEILVGTLDPLLDAVRDGTLRGVAGLVYHEKLNYGTTSRIEKLK